MSDHKGARRPARDGAGVGVVQLGPIVSLSPEGSRSKGKVMTNPAAPLSRAGALAQAVAYVNRHFRHTHHEFRDAFTKGFAMALMSEEDRGAFQADAGAFGEWTAP